MKAHFIKTVVDPKLFPPFPDKPEIAVVGRSNVGKSTLLNLLFQAKNLVKTSSTPGKTQAVNFFSFLDTLIFADLPGYGYAKVPASSKRNWAYLIESYLQKPPALILFLLDMRRNPSAQDLQMYDWIRASGIPTLLVLTKADKLKMGEKAKQKKAILSKIDLPHIETSAEKKIGRKELLGKIKEAVA